MTAHQMARCDNVQGGEEGPRQNERIADQRALPGEFIRIRSNHQNNAEGGENSNSQHASADTFL